MNHVEYTNKQNQQIIFEYYVPTEEDFQDIFQDFYNFVGEHPNDEYKENVRSSKKHYRALLNEVVVIRLSMKDKKVASVWNLERAPAMLRLLFLMELFYEYASITMVPHVDEYQKIKSLLSKNNKYRYANEGIIKFVGSDIYHKYGGKANWSASKLGFKKVT